MCHKPECECDLRHRLLDFVAFEGFDLGKIIITGAGRAGTSFVMRLFIRLGLDTGFSAEKDGYGGAVRAGCEWRIEAEYAEPFELLKAAIDRAPRILKSPDWGLLLKEFIDQGFIEVDHVFIPWRDLDVAAKSRLDVGLGWQICEDIDDYDYQVMDQASVHALAFGRAIEACLVHRLPYTLMEFPRFVEDGEYCWQKLSEGVEMNRKEFDAVYDGLANPQQIKWR